MTAEHAARPPQMAPPCSIVIFGATGDLTARKLLPALFRLRRQGLLDPETVIVGYGRSAPSDDEFREKCRQVWQKSVHDEDAGQWPEVARHIFSQRGSYDQREDFAALKKRLDELEARFHTEQRRIFYLATPPKVFTPIAENLAAAGLIHDPGEDQPFSRVAFEKPFGHDFASAQALDARLLEVLDEEQIHRIDHYLGKETVQNLLVFRFANGIFEPLWNAAHISHVQITVAETIGVESRGGYYDQSGALKDMIQNHVLQLLALVAMEPPIALTPEAIHDEKAKVLRALRPFRREREQCCTLRGQYTTGDVLGQAVPAYRDEKGVDPQSQTETYVAIRASIDNWRWAGVPFYIRTGKRLARRLSEIQVVFRPVPQILFGASEDGGHIRRNVLTLRIQPNEGFWLRVNSKQPGVGMQVRPVGMDFAYAQYFDTEIPEAYERLLHDLVVGDRTLFTHAREVEAAWAFVDSVVQTWREEGRPLLPYPAGSWGPAEAEAMLTTEGDTWRNSFDEEGLIGQRCALPPRVRSEPEVRRAGD